jgi:hypothetical protein
VSVLVTALNNERFVARAIDSVLRQGVRDLELLVLDDGSVDSTPAVLERIRDSRVRIFLCDTTAGISSRRNELVERACGEYIAPLDADDLWMPLRLDRLVTLMESRPELAVAGSDVMLVDDRGTPGAYQRVPRSDAAIRWCCFFTSPIVHSSALIRSSAFAAGIRYDEAYPLAQDYDLWVKLLRSGRAVNVPAALTLYRVHAAQATSRSPGARVVEQGQIGSRLIARAMGHDEIAGREARLVWRLGAGAEVTRDDLDDAILAYRELFGRFAASCAPRTGIGEARRIAATMLLRRAGGRAEASARSLRRAALAIDPTAPASAFVVRLDNRLRSRRHRRIVARLASDPETSSG